MQMFCLPAETENDPLNKSARVDRHYDYEPQAGSLTCERMASSRWRLSSGDNTCLLTGASVMSFFTSKGMNRLSAALSTWKDTHRTFHHPGCLLEHTVSLEIFCSHKCNSGQLLTQDNTRSWQILFCPADWKQAPPQKTMGFFPPYTRVNNSLCKSDRAIKILW